MYFLSHGASLFVADRHINVAGGLGDTVATPFGARSKTFQAGSALDTDGGYFKFVNVGAVVVLSIGNRRFQYFPDNRRASFRTEREDVKRLVHRQAADLVRH